MERVLTVAAPATAATVKGPLSVPVPGGLVPMATVTLAVESGPALMTTPAPSSTDTRTVNAVWDTGDAGGWVVQTNR